mgnify:CR=1 FL=1
MKKVLLSSVVALAVFSTAAPVFAQGENPASSNQLIQKKYVSWRDAADEAEKLLNAHDAEIKAEAAQQPAVVAAQQALDAYGSGHLYGAYVAKRDAAFNEAYNVVRNRYRQEYEERYIKDAMAQGNYYNENGVEANRTNEQRIADDQEAQTGKAPVASADNGAKPGAANNGAKPGAAANKDEAKNSESKAGAAAKAGKADSKQAGKALPKTSAVK